MMNNHARCPSDTHGLVRASRPTVAACLAVVLTQLPGVANSAVGGDSVRLDGAMFVPERSVDADASTPDAADIDAADVDAADTDATEVEATDAADAEAADAEAVDVEAVDVEAVDAEAPDPAAIARLETALEQLTERTGALAETVAAFEQEQRSRAQALDDLTQRVERQASRRAAMQSGDTAARVLALVNRAADALGSAGDVEAAVAALKIARQQAGMAEGYADVESAIDAYLGALAARMGDDSVPRLRADLEQRCGDVPALPARPLPNPKPPLERVSEAEPRDVGGWREVFAALWQDLMDQVSVRSVDAAAPQVRPEQVAYARVALFGLCDAIDGALAARDGDRARRYAGTAAGMARATFDPEDAKVEAFVGVLDGVTTAEVPAYPGFTPIVETLGAVLAPADGAVGD